MTIPRNMNAKIVDFLSLSILWNFCQLSIRLCSFLLGEVNSIAGSTVDIITGNSCIFLNRESMVKFYPLTPTTYGNLFLFVSIVHDELDNKRV